MTRLLTFVVLIAALSPSIATAQDCDRTCLKDALDRYLTAVIKHDPSAAPLMIGFRQTENAVAVRLGTGVSPRTTGR